MFISTAAIDSATSGLVPLPLVINLCGNELTRMAALGLPPSLCWEADSENGQSDDGSDAEYSYSTEVPSGLRDLIMV